MIGKLLILDHTGHTEVEWDTADRLSVEVAKAKFDEIIAFNYLAYTVEDTATVPAGSAPGANATSGFVTRKFDETAAQIVMAPQTVGG